MKVREVLFYQQCDCCLRRDIDHPEIEMVEEFYNVHICTDCSANNWGIYHKEDIQGKIGRGEFARLSDIICIKLDKQSNDFDYSEIKSIRHSIKTKKENRWVII